MKKSAIFAIAMVCLLVTGAPAWSQAVGLRVQGKVTDKGQPQPGLQVVLTNGDNARSYKSKTDKNGAVDLIGVGAGNNYQVEIFSQTGEQLFNRSHVAITAQSTAIIWTIDISNPALTNIGGIAVAANAVSKYTAEQLAALKAQREKAAGQNALITQANLAMNTKQWNDAIPPLQQLIAFDPDRYELYSGLGNAQFQAGQYEAALQSYDKGIQLANAQTKEDPKNPYVDPVKRKVLLAGMLNNQGNAFLKLHRNNEAIAAYTQAAEFDPNPATAYFNLCATQYNAAAMENAVAACDKAIAANPMKADAYFIKGSSLYGSGTLDKQGHYQVPPGTLEALQKYLELAPKGPHAVDVKAMLEGVGAKIETTYKEKKK